MSGFRSGPELLKIGVFQVFILGFGLVLNSSKVEFFSCWFWGGVWFWIQENWGFVSFRYCGWGMVLDC